MRRSRPVFVRIRIAAPLERVWALTQDTGAHPRWDLRFSSIEQLDPIPGGGMRFRYTRRTPLHTVVGTGTSIGDRTGAGGTRTSALRFTTSDRLSPLGAGRGYWRYEPEGDATWFTTGYDYEAGWGRVLDRVVVRPLVGWATAWSFDRLRIWAERDEAPERWPVASVLWWWRPERPRAARCRRRAARVMEDAPESLAGLDAP